jgi:pSer/pThr/pTyr-binding forkhead associated (FHA) protein
MPKLVVMTEGRILVESPLGEEEVLIGRGGDCHIVLRDPSVSRHHAKVTPIHNGFFVEDLRSTNGVLLNGRRVRKHVLKDGDLVQIGTHELRFVSETVAAAEAPEPDLPAAATSRGTERQRGDPHAPVERGARAYVRFLSGPDMGDSKLVDKTLYTIGEPGGDLAVISRRAQGHFLLHLGGRGLTTLNGMPVQGAGVKLNNGDQIQVGDTQLEFFSEP